MVDLKILSHLSMQEQMGNIRELFEKALALVCYKT